MSDPNTLTVYRTRGCPYCIAAVQLLTERGISFHEEFLDDHPDRRAFTARLHPGHRTVPLILRGELAIGGMDDLRESLARGDLDDLIRNGG